jgi:hypothetical protein
MDEISVVDAQIFKLASPLTQDALKERLPKSKPEPAASVDLSLLLLAPLDPNRCGRGQLLVVLSDTRFTDLSSACRHFASPTFALFRRRGTGSLRS